MNNQVVSVLFLTGNHAMKAYWGAKVQLHTILTLALDGGGWSASCLTALLPGEEPLIPTG